MGTESYIEIIHTPGEELRAEESVSRAIALCFAKVGIFTRFDPESELSRLNEALGDFIESSPDMIAIATRSLDYARESDGLFDPRILPVLEDIGYREDFSAERISHTLPSEAIRFPTHSLARDLSVLGERIRIETPMDFSGIAKGYIIDRMAEALFDDGWTNFLVDSGGDIRVSGTNIDGKAWRIDIENAPFLSVLAVSDRGIATSGLTRRQWEASNGKRYHHLINPKNPYHFSFDLLSVTALSISSERADFLAKTLFLMGSDEGLSCAEKYSIPAIFVLAPEQEDAQISCLTSSSIKNAFLSSGH